MTITGCDAEDSGWGIDGEDDDRRGERDEVEAKEKRAEVAYQTLQCWKEWNFRE